MASESQKRAIIKKAFDELYKDLKEDLSTYLTHLKRNGPRTTDSGLSVGRRWSPTSSGMLLLEVTPADLALVQSTKELVGRFYKDKKGLIEYQAPAHHKGVSFLLSNQWGDAKSNKDVCDSINSVALSLGKDPYISEAEEEIMMAPSSKTKTGGTKTKSEETKIPEEKIPTTPLIFPLNLILYGPPGTGKTYNTIFKTLEILGEPEKDRDAAVKRFNELKDAGRIVFTTFHQSMSYEDFIEGIKPNLDGSSVGYKIQDGIFKQIARTASQEDNRNKRFVLIIDEINRGNVANIFGELITLIEDDKRTTKYDKEKGVFENNPEGLRIKLPYSKKKDFGVPGNLHIIGTMNTADRSVEALDSALRRRFSFEEMMPDPKLLESVTIVGIGKTLKYLLETINERIEALKDREHQIGHSYFMGFVQKDDDGKVVDSTVSPDDLKSVFTDKIIPLLQEYFYGDYEKIKLVVGDGFVNEASTKVTFAGNNSSYDEYPEKRYNIEKEPKMESAIKTLLNS